MDNTQTNSKAREVAEQVVSTWTMSDVFNDTDRRNNVEQAAENRLADLITAAIEKAVGEIEQRGEA